MPNKTSAIQSQDLILPSVKVFVNLLDVKRFQIPPLPISHAAINPNANDLELDLLMFYFESVNHPVTESDLKIIYGLTNNEYSLHRGKNPFEGLPLSFEVTEHNLEVITKALKIAASRLGFAAAMACNSQSFLSDDIPQINTAKWFYFSCCFKLSAVPRINTAEIKMKLVARYLMTFFFLDDILEKNNASNELLSAVESIFKNKLNKIVFKNKKDAVILRMVQNVVKSVRDLLDTEFPNMSDQLYNQFIKSYFEQVKSVVEECRQKKMYESGHYPENELFFINRTLTIGYYPLVKLVDSLLGVYESNSNLLVKTLDDIGARRLHLINGLLSFEVEMSKLLPKNKLTGEADFDLNRTAHELFELVNKSDFNTPTDAFTNELLVYSLNHNVSIIEAIHVKVFEYNNLGHNALIISCELLKAINPNRHRFSDQFIEAVMMRIKFNLVEAEDYHLLTARYRLSREVNFELQGYLLSGKLRKGGDFSLEEFTNKFTLTQRISEETLIAQHERISRLFYGLTANSQLRMDQIESFIQFDSTIITFDRSQKDDLDRYSNYCIYGPPGIGKSAFVKSFVDYKRTLWLSAKDVSTVTNLIQLFNLKNKSDLNCFSILIRVHFDFLVIDAIETLPDNHMFLNDLINHFKMHGCSILLTSQQELLSLPDSFKPLELEPVDLKDLASNTSGLNEVPSVLIPIIQIPLYFKFFVEFKDLIASGKFDLFDADSLEPFFPSTVLKDFLLEFKLAASIDYNSKKHVLNKEAFQVILIKLLKRQFLFEEITFTKKESLFLDEYKRIGILNEKGKFTLNTYLEYAWRSFFDHELNHGVSIKRIESIFKVFPESYYLFIPFIGKLKELELYDGFISSTKIWDSFDTRIMVLRSICNA
ncbi:MAG: terpene synthase family protein, partial [Candidatus Margulisiibacteriota bacterium]|nr:terpene synthase family protein [Candidatus Margulisiibacteriota bacterium]